MDTLCFSHLRWNFVYQRPQHLLSRFTKKGRVFYIEEPIETDLDPYYEINRDSELPNLWVVNFYISKNEPQEGTARQMRDMLDLMLKAIHITDYIAWYYTPMALAYTQHLNPRLIVYDCMDELSAFRFAPAELKESERCLFDRADIVFAGGATLYQAKKCQHRNVFLFPSSIDKMHFKTARLPQPDPADQADIAHPRLGFYGVLDERLHTSLIAEAAALRPDWHFIFIGPVVKIDPATLPTGSNIHYLGAKSYAQLPAYLAGWDIAILPFELNDSTRYISPTKTPEYLAGGKPVISTPITDVVNPYHQKGLVRIADTAADFVREAEPLLGGNGPGDWLKRVDHFLKDMSWDHTYRLMNELIDQELAKKQFVKPEKKTSYV